MSQTNTGLALDTGMPLSAVTKTARDAERQGFASLWVSEDPYFRDLVTTLSALAAATERVSIAACIANMFSRNPVYMAMAAGTLDEMSGSRFILGLGRGIQTVMQGELHVRYGSHLTYAREYLKCLGGLLRGEEVTFEGKEVSLTGSRLRFQLQRKGGIPILLAAMGPKMLKVAGELADGAILNCCTSVRHAKTAAESLRLAGKSSPRMGCYLWTNIDEDQDRAYDFARTRVGYILSVPTFGETFLKASNLPSDFLPELRKAYRWDVAVGDPIWHLEHVDAKAVGGLVPDEVVDALSVCGPVERCRTRLKEYVNAGVTDPIVGPMNPATYESARLLI